METLPKEILKTILREISDRDYVNLLLASTTLKTLCYVYRCQRMFIREIANVRKETSESYTCCKGQRSVFSKGKEKRWFHGFSLKGRIYSGVLVKTSKCKVFDQVKDSIYIHDATCEYNRWQWPVPTLRCELCREQGETCYHRVFERDPISIDLCEIAPKSCYAEGLLDPKTELS